MNPRSGRWLAREELSRHRVYLAVARRRGRAVVSSSTQLVIEGFPRSASSFAVAAFQSAQPFAVPVAHHLHSVAHVREAVRLGLPTLVTIREPRDTVVSTAIYSSAIGVEHALTAYTRFYEGLEPLRAQLVVGEFGLITSDFGSIVERVNRRFGTGFVRFEHTPESVTEVFELLELSARYRRRPGAVRPYLSGRAGGVPSVAGAPPASERVIARPSRAREALRSEYHTKFADPRLAPLRVRADAVYTRLIENTRC